MRPPREFPEQDPAPRWDWVTVMVVLFVVIVVLWLTFDAWAPHGM